MSTDCSHWSHHASAVSFDQVPLLERPAAAADEPSQPRRVAHHEGVIGDVPRDHGPRAYHGKLADDYVGKHDRAGAQRGARA